MDAALGLDGGNMSWSFQACSLPTNSILHARSYDIQVKFIDPSLPAPPSRTFSP